MEPLNVVLVSLSSVECRVQEGLRAGEVVGECDAPKDDLKEDEEEGVDDLGHAVEIFGHPQGVIIFLLLDEILGGIHKLSPVHSGKKEVEGLKVA